MKVLVDPADRRFRPDSREVAASRMHQHPARCFLHLLASSMERSSTLRRDFHAENKCNSARSTYKVPPRCDLQATPAVLEVSYGHETQL